MNCSLSLIEKFWADFCNNHGISKSSHYEAYSFGDPESADYISDLVKNGIKTATSSALELYEENERIPQAGDYNVILDSQNLPICVTQTKVVEIVPFNQIMVEHAYHEGEGNRSYEYWHNAHVKFFNAEFKSANKVFTDSSPIVCVVFELIK